MSDTMIATDLVPLAPFARLLPPVGPADAAAAPRILDDARCTRRKPGGETGSLYDQLRNRGGNPAASAGELGMKTRSIAGVPVSAIGFGGAGFSVPNAMALEDITRTVHAALDAGTRLFDTATFYL